MKLFAPATAGTTTRRTSAPPREPRRVVFDIAALTVTVDGLAHVFPRRVVPARTIRSNSGAYRGVPAGPEPAFDAVERAFVFAEAEATRLGTKSVLVGAPEPSRACLEKRAQRGSDGAP